MLDGLRKGAARLLVLLLFALLILSFVVWGVADMFRGFGSNTLLTVGERSYSPQAYQQIFDRHLQTLNLRFNQRISPQVARRLGLDQQIFSQLVVDEHVRDLGLGLSDQGMLERLNRDRSLHDASGKLDPRAFQAMLQARNISEAAYLQLDREDALRDQLMGTIGVGAPPPAVLLEAVHQFQSEERVIEYFLVPPGKAPAVAKPDEAKLKEFYEANSSDYRAPELRRFELLVGTPQSVQSQVEVSAADIAAFYEAHKADFAIAERRKVRQMTFPDKAAADKAHAELKAGKDFLTVAKAAGFAEKDVERGLVRLADLLDPKAAAAAFALAKGTFSEPVEGALAWSIFEVSEIEPGSQETLEQTKDRIRDRLALERAQKRIIELYAAVEDLRAGGSPLKDIADKLRLPLTVVGDVDSQGNGPDGKPVALAVPAGALPQVLRLAFESDAGVENNAIDLGREGYIWLNVLEVKPDRQKPMDEVKAALEADYVAAEQATALGTLARGLAERAGKGEDLAKLAKELGAEAKTAKPFNRLTQEAEVPPSVRQLAFAQPKGGAAALPAADGQGRIVFRVKEIVPAKPLDEARRKTLAGQLAEQSGGILLNEYVQAVQGVHKLDVNRELFERLVGSTDGEP